jgi:TfoX/Sxy family transcriptional regulator of competence genes
VAYDEHLAQRVRAVLSADRDISERKMFGGLAFLSRGHMLCGVIEDALTLRLGEDGSDEALDEPHVRPMDFTGRPMRTMIFVDAPGMISDYALAAWIGRARAFVATLPAKRL